MKEKHGVYFHELECLKLGVCFHSLELVDTIEVRVKGVQDWERVSPISVAQMSVSLSVSIRVQDWESSEHGNVPTLFL